MPGTINEFNQAVGLIFAQLYTRFPEPTDIDQPATAKAFGVDDRSWASHTLPSGRALGALLGMGDRTSFGASAEQRVLLTEKGLRALNAVPPGLSGTIGTELKKAVERGSWPDLDQPSTASKAAGLMLMRTMRGWGRLKARRGHLRTTPLG